MYLQELTLHNIGPFAGENTVDFRVNQTENIVLIGGNNGSGKTTLLNSIKIALFGSHAYGFTTNSVTYMKKIISLMHKKAVQKKNERFFLKIKFDAIEQYEKNEYCIIREWKDTNHSIDDFSFQEHVTVYKNDVKLNAKEQEDYLNEMKLTIQPPLINSVMFDGENVANIIEEGKLDSYIHDVFYNCFNFNLFDTFQNDIQKYLSKLKNQSNLSEEEMKSLEIRQEINGLKKKIDINESYLKVKKKKQKDLYEKRKSLLERFRNLGGLTKKQLKTMEQDLSDLEKDRKTMMTEVREFLEGPFPLVLNKQLFNSALDAIKKDYPHVLARRIQKMSEKENIPEDALELLGNFMSRYRDTTTDLLFQDITEDQIDTLEKQWDIIKDLKISKYRNKFNKSQSDLEIEGRLKSNYSENKESEALTEITEQVNDVQNQLSELEEEINTSELTVNELKDALTVKREYLENVEKEIFTSKKKSKSFVMAQNILKLNASFIDQQVKKQVKALERLALDNFNRATNKEHFISLIKIDPSTFEVSLYDHNGTKHSEKILSAGEKQIMVASIVKAIFELAKRRLMFVYDTPLARLDRKNRTSFSEEIMSKVSKQVIILSTDAEVVGDVFDHLKNRINKTYLLKSNNDGFTEIQNSYFRGETI